MTPPTAPKIAEALGPLNAVPTAPPNGTFPVLTAANREWGELQVLPNRQDEFQQRFLRTVNDLLQSSNLVVLTGLGPSLCVKSDGKRVAPTMGDLWKEVSGREDFDQILQAVNHPRKDEQPIEDIELLLSHCQLAELLQPNPAVTAFIKDAEAIIVKRCRFITSKTELSVHEQFLRKTARRSTRHPRMKLFTTNYDLCFETAAGRSRFTVVDGFSHTHPQEFDGSHFDFDLVRRSATRETPEYVPNVFHLYKIHGSVDWTLDSDYQAIRREANTNTPHLIYPRHTKYESSYSQPFLEMMARLQMTLRQPNTGLLIVGFGFNDFHINQPILAAINSNVSLKCLIVSPSLKDNEKENSVLGKVGRMIRAGDSRLSMLACGFEDFVPMVPDLVALTEEEQHRDRVRGAEQTKND